MNPDDLTILADLLRRTRAAVQHLGRLIEVGGDPTQLGAQVASLEDALAQQTFAVQHRVCVSWGRRDRRPRQPPPARIVPPLESSQLASRSGVHVSRYEMTGRAVTEAHGGPPRLSGKWAQETSQKRRQRRQP
jgi:hypothetical protein